MTTPVDDSKKVGVLLSGGLDSAILVAHLLQAGDYVRPFYVRCGLRWEKNELASVQQFLSAIRQPRLAELITFDLPLHDLYRNHWSITGDGVPDSATEDAAVFLPGRNALLLIKAALWCQIDGVSRLALAPLASNPFADASDQFFSLFEQLLGHTGQQTVRVERPFATLKKQAVMQLGRDLPLELTFSCIAPRDNQHCGQCNKCAERQDAFRQAGLVDKTRYAGA